jgi:hypothetical protein
MWEQVTVKGGVLGFLEDLAASSKATFEGMAKGDPKAYTGQAGTGNGQVSGTGDGGAWRPVIPGREELLRYYDENVKGHSTRSFEDWLKEIANR